MFIWTVSLAAIATVWSLSNSSIATSAPAPTGGSNFVLNRQFAAAVFPSIPPKRVHLSASEGLPPPTDAGQHRKPDLLTSPTFLAVAARFASAERILHYRAGGFDANFWGAFDRGRGIRIGYSVHL